MTDIINPKSYLEIGAGGISFLVLVAVLVYIVKSIKPAMKAQEVALEKMKISVVNLNNSSVNTNNVLDRVDRAIEENAKSNDNVASALELLTLGFKGINSTLENQSKILDKHDARSEEIQNEVIKISERTKSCKAVSKG